LLNDPEASLAVALAAGAGFIRTDYFVDEMRRPAHGVMRIAPEAVMSYRASIGAEHVLVLADIQVKYAQMLTPRALTDSARAARERRPDAIVVTGTRTGEPPSGAEVMGARAGAGECPVLVGSGLAPGNARDLLEIAAGGIVGTSLMSEGRATSQQVRALVEARA
jgi:predicted TIM-barrel enzyme